MKHVVKNLSVSGQSCIVPKSTFFPHFGPDFQFFTVAVKYGKLKCMFIKSMFVHIHIHRFPCTLLFILNGIYISDFLRMTSLRDSDSG